MSEVPQYFAQVTNGVVTDVRVVSAEFMAENPDRYPGIWVETFIDLPNKTYAGIGYTYDADSGDFVAPEVVEVPLP
jgi:hypothetical protein